MQLLSAHVVPSSVQIKSEKLRLTRPAMRVAVGVHRKRPDGRDALAHDPFDGGTDLAAHWRQGLIVRDAPLIEDRLIDAHAMNSAFGIDARIIEVLACIQTHQIGGSFESGTPVTDDVMATGEVQERIVGLAQRRLGFEQAHVVPNPTFVNAADHGRHAAGLQIGARREQRPIHAEQFFGALGFPTQQLPAEMHLSIQLQ
jgi:hypothetical protein